MASAGRFYVYAERADGEYYTAVHEGKTRAINDAKGIRRDMPEMVTIRVYGPIQGWEPDWDNENNEPIWFWSKEV